MLSEAHAPTRRHQRAQRGALMAIGGAEETTGSPAVLETFVGLGGGQEARIALIPTASREPSAAAEKYTRVFRDLGAVEVAVIQAETRAAADRDEAVDILRDATGIFISGGDQNRL